MTCVHMWDAKVRVILYKAWTRQKLPYHRADTAGHRDTLGHAGIHVSHRIS